MYKVVPQKFCAVGLNPQSGLNQGLKTLAEILPLDKALNSQLFFYSLTRTSILSDTSISNHAFYFQSSFNPHK